MTKIEIQIQEKNLIIESNDPSLDIEKLFFSIASKIWPGERFSIRRDGN